MRIMFSKNLKHLHSIKIVGIMDGAMSSACHCTENYAHLRGIRAGSFFVDLKTERIVHHAAWSSMPLWLMKCPRHGRKDARGTPP
jgi:hypothetical protein